MDSNSGIQRVKNGTNYKSILKTFAGLFFEKIQALLFIFHVFGIIFSKFMLPYARYVPIFHAASAVCQ